MKRRKTKNGGKASEQESNRLSDRIEELQRLKREMARVMEERNALAYFAATYGVPPCKSIAACEHCMMRNVTRSGCFLYWAKQSVLKESGEAHDRQIQAKIGH